MKAIIETISSPADSDRNPKAQATTAKTHHEVYSTAPKKPACRGLLRTGAGTRAAFGIGFALPAIRRDKVCGKYSTAGRKVSK
ncbi:MAG: hypothetical protein OXF43_12175 [Gammaproteobacteria bacterium]|nr:hypothetical protein [Gammaproteobacteria bacterium]